MRQCLTPGDLETLLACVDDMDVEVVREMPEGVAAANVRVEMQTPIAPVRLAPAMAEEDESSDDGSTQPDVRGDRLPERVLYLSNAHIELMLIHALGPADVTEACAILRVIKMAKDVPFTKLSTATSFIREWKDGLRWCGALCPPEKAMVRFFLDAVIPRKLAYAIKNTGVRTVEAAMNMLFVEYRRGYNAKNLLTGIEDSARLDTKPTAAPIPAAVPKPLTAVIAAPTRAPPAVPKTEDWKKSKVCFKCGQTGHISPDCPLKAGTPGAATPGNKKFGVMAIGGKGKPDPYLTIDLTPLKDGSDRVLRMMCHMDGGAQCDGIGENWDTYSNLQRRHFATSKS
jgi:hypothetical protein